MTMISFGLMFIKKVAVRCVVLGFVLQFDSRLMSCKVVCYLSTIEMVYINTRYDVLHVCIYI